MTRQRSKGGVGTNQYQVRGHAVPKRRITPQFAAQVLDSFDADQLQNMADVRLLKQTAQLIQLAYPKARYLKYQDSGGIWDPWRFVTIMNSDGIYIESEISQTPSQIHTNINRIATVFGSKDQYHAVGKKPYDVSSLLWDNITLDLDAAQELEAMHAGTVAFAEHAVQDPDIQGERLAQLATHPEIAIRRAAVAHPNCPEHIRAITALGN